MIDFLAPPPPPQHWEVEAVGAVATLRLGVNPTAAAHDGYDLKLNSYDIAVDIELANLVRQIRFEQPEVGCVVITGATAGTFCAGANIGMLAGSSHAHKVNFCKFTNETRLDIERASAEGGLRFLAAVNGACSGGGYELALACDHILLVDDRSTAVSLPEVPLLGVLPGTGGLTRLTDKRGVRRDLADVFATRVEGCRGNEALEWGLVDELATPTTFDEAVAARAAALVATSRANNVAAGADEHNDETQGSSAGQAPLQLPDVTLSYGSASEAANGTSNVAEGSFRGRFVAVVVDHERRVAEMAVLGSRDTDWPLVCALELDAALCHLRFNEPDVGTLVLYTVGDAADVLHHDAALAAPATHIERETAALWGVALRRLDLTARSLVAAIEPGSCFAGVLAELALAADRSYMLDGMFEDDRPSDAIGAQLRTLVGLDEPTAPATLTLTASNTGPFPMTNGLSRLAARFYKNQAALDAALGQVGTALEAAQALSAGLVTFAPDDIDYDDELAVAVAERAAMSPDALTAMEANHRFSGPETMATKIFGRLTAWQNWVFSRPNATGPASPLRRYGTGQRAVFDWERT